MTGARIIANKPIAVSWGQDTDRTYYNDQALDTGFTIYPVNQLFLDPALTIDKEVNTTAVPTESDPAERTVTYTLTVKSYEFGPLADVEVWDLLPPGVLANSDPLQSDYFQGSTLITCPDLVQGTVDPTFEDCAGVPGVDCGRLSWDIEGACETDFTMGTNNTLTISYQIVIPETEDGPRLLTNEAHAQATLGGSVFAPFDTAHVVQTDVTLTKAVDVSTPAAGDTVTFTLEVANTGSTDEEEVYITDPIPPDTTFSGSIDSDGPFTGTYNAAQNAVVWYATDFLTATGPYSLSFQVRINPTVPSGTLIPNRAGYESSQTPYFLSNEVEPVVQGPALDALKSIVGDPAEAHPNESIAFEIVITNAGSADANNVLLSDAFPANASYQLQSIQWSLNSAPFVSLTDANDGVEASGADGRAFSDRIEFRLTSLGPSQNVAIRFSVLIDPGTDGEFLIDQALFASDETPSTDTNLVQVPIVGDANITGHVFLDLDADGVQDAGEPNLSDVDVVIEEAGGAMRRVSTDANGDYLVTVEAGLWTADVDETDPDFPANASLTTAPGCSAPPTLPCNDPQTVTAVSGNTVATGDVGYDPPPLTFTKTSNAVGGQVSPGETITYTLSATNVTGVTQTNVTVTDPLPAGTNAVLGSTSVTVTNPVFRVSEYSIPAGTFADGETTFDLTLGQDLAPNYFAIVQGSANPGNSDTGPHQDYARITQDPFGTGVLGTSTGSTVLRLARGNGALDWIGVVTVVECLAACDTAGFELLTIEEVVAGGSTLTGAVTILPAEPQWTDMSRVLLMGGFNGAGCSTNETTDVNHPVCHLRLYPSGTDQINWTRNLSGTSGGLDDATNTVMVVQWGSEWAVQRVNVTGTDGGGGLDAAGEYNTASLLPAVNRDTSWVWGTGHADGLGIGDQGEGVVYTLGNGVTQNSSEGTVAAGTEWDGTAVDFEIWVLTHPSMAVDYRFKTDDDRGSETVDVPVDSAGGQRMALVSNGQGDDDDNYPRPIFSARYLNDTTVRLQRQRSGEPFPAWVEGVDFSGVIGQANFAGGDPESVPPGDALLVPGPSPAPATVNLSSSGTIEVTFDVVVDPTLEPTAIPQIINIATLDTDQEAPLHASATDQTVKVGVVVEYDNAGFDLEGETVVYSHEVVNTGSANDSFDITLEVEEGWDVELIDPSTGSVIATDLDGNGIWDGSVTINTGTLAPGESAPYEIRITIPASEPAGNMETTSLLATSTRKPSVRALATDETIVVDALDKVILLPDNSGVGLPLGYVVYSHTVINNTGSPDTFDLTVARPDGSPTVGWDPAAFHWDSNSDGVYTDGVDIAISNTVQLDHGESQLVFVVMEIPDASTGSVDVVHLGAFSRNPAENWFATATDTTTVAPPTELDLSGGGTRTVNPGAPAIFPGTLRNLTDVQVVYDIQISPAFWDGLDTLDHPTELWVDPVGNGTFEMIAEDLQGDGIWDDDNGGALSPTMSVAADGERSYELRRSTVGIVNPIRDPVTLTAKPQNNENEQDSITATVLLAAATAAQLASFEAVTLDGQVVLEWRTAAEIGTIGFDVLRESPVDGQFTQVNEAVIRAVGHLQGGTYRMLDPGAEPGASLRYLLVEHDVWGASRSFGPFEVTSTNGDPVKKSARVPVGGVESRPNRSSIRSPSVTKALKASGERSGLVKIMVREAGLVKVTAEQLATALESDPATVSTWIESGNLWINAGSVAGLTSIGIFSDGFESGSTERWGAGTGDDDPHTPQSVDWIATSDNSGLLFYAEALDSIYTLDNVYWLGVGEGRRMATRVAAPGGGATGADFFDFAHFEEEQWPLTSVMTDSEIDFWMWDYFFPYDGEPVVSKTFVLATPGAAATGSTASLTVHLQGSLISEVSPNHLVEVRINNTQLGGLESWSGHDAEVLQFEFAQSLLNDGDNTVELTARLADGLDFDEFYLDGFDLGYERYYVAEDDRLVATSGGAAEILVTGFTSSEIAVFDLSDPRHPILLDETQVIDAGGQFNVKFAASEGLSAFLATTIGAASAPADVVPDIASDLGNRDNAGRWVVIAGPGLEAEAETLAAYRRSQGLTAVVARIGDIYDEFNGGITNPWAVRDFLHFAADSWAEGPEFVFLAGDGTLDYRDFWNTGENLILAPMAVTGDGLVPSDNLLGDWAGGDGVPEVAIGRLPAQSAAELAAYRAKVMAFEASSGAWKNHTVWLADAPDAGGEFIEDIASLIDGAPEAYSSEEIFLDRLLFDDARQRTIDAINSGAVLLHFLGHGSLDSLSSNGLLTIDDVAGLSNGEKAPFLAALTCMVGRFDLPDYDILSEALLVGDSGSIGVWAPAAFSMNADAVRLGQHHLAAVTSGEHSTIGGSVRAALQAYVATGEGDPLLPKIFVFLGDPATRVNW